MKTTTAILQRRNSFLPYLIFIQDILLTRTVTDANNKTVTTVSDKYGRVTNVNRPEFSTTYVYDGDGLLTNETSTNGTSAVFTYDTYDRPATARENAPDG